MAAPADEDYEHWPDDGRLAAAPADPTTRYDSRNGLHEHMYRPAGEVKESIPELPKQQAAAPPQYMQYAPMAYGFGPMGAGMMPHMAYPAPAYYGYPQHNEDKPRDPLTARPSKDDGLPDSKRRGARKQSHSRKNSPPRKWQGRTRAEVEEDDMKLAASEGAYAPCKVAPLDMADDQLVWVVEGEEPCVLRTYAEVTAMKGKWKPDPRFTDAWFFVRETEEGEGQGKK